MKLLPLKHAMPFICLLALACGSISAWAQDGQQALDALAEVGRAIRENTCWRAEYVQEYLPPGMTLGDELKGQVWISWPDKALFLSGEEPQQAMGMSGRTARVVDPKLPSCDEHVLSEEEWARFPLAAVLNPSRALENFSVLEVGERRFALEPVTVQGIRRVEVQLDAKGMPAEVVIFDPQGAKNRLTFTAWTSSVEPSLGWLPEPPKGVSCAGDLGSERGRVNEP